MYNLELHNNEPSVAGCIFFNKLPNNIKQTGNDNQFKKEVKDLLIKGFYYSHKIISVQNSVILADI
jgi:hypothetical protein